MTFHVSRLLVAVTITATALAIGACTEPTESGFPSGSVSSSVSGIGIHQPGVHRQYGKPVKVGNGTVRTYVVIDQKNGGRPLEVGVAMSEKAMDGLPAAAAAGAGHEDMAMTMHMYLLDMPARNATPYRFVQFDWNPAGHEPEGIYTLPHFDFHFYTVDRAVRSSIVPSDPLYAAKAANFPAQEFRAPFYAIAAPPQVPPAALAVPEMGLHWSDMRSPELQGAIGNPDGFRPFTKTFIHGSWDGQFIFEEPMITRDYMLAKRHATSASERDEIIPIPVPAQRQVDGYYPSAYRITYDAKAKEYRVALTQLAWQD